MVTKHHSTFFDGAVDPYVAKIAGGDHDEVGSKNVRDCLESTEKTAVER